MLVHRDTLPSLIKKVTAAPNSPVSDDQIRAVFSESLSDDVASEHVLVLVPDRTRTMPLRRLFPLLREAMGGARNIDVMVALGTHPPLSGSELEGLVGVEKQDHRNLSLGNHAWDDNRQLQAIGVLTKQRVQEIAARAWHPSLGGDVPIRVNRAALECDRIIILGPVFPHEVAGFSGGVKYLFPGISGPEFIDVSHWLGALVGIDDTIGLRDTPTRAMIEAAAELVPTPITLIATVVNHDGDVQGIFAGDRHAAWKEAVELSSRLHITWLDSPLERVISCAPSMYDELWTAGKAVYKLQPVMAAGGDVIVYAPHLDTVSHALGKHIFEVGYHVLPYFLDQWDRLEHVPLAVLAHSTHVKGPGEFHNGIEHPKFHVSLASKISAEDCRTLNLGYVDPDTMNPSAPPAGFTVIDRAGETLYRLTQ